MLAQSLLRLVRVRVLVSGVLRSGGVVVVRITVRERGLSSGGAVELCVLGVAIMRNITIMLGGRLLRMDGGGGLPTVPGGRDQS